MAVSDELRKLVDPNNECYCENCLSNKCKKWASKKDLYIMSFVSYATQGMGEATVYDVDGKLKTFTEDKEYIAIFKACEWILKDKR